MLSTKQVQDFLARVTYKPGWFFQAYDGRWEGQHVVITTVVPDAYHLDKTVTLDVHSMLPPMRKEDDLKNWLMWRLARIEVHEMREFFRIDGEVADDPHKEFANRDL